ncbi:leucine-rich repeat protein [Raoultibacter phocaeensis]|uniref:leucine-rich repeat protein n=1 Tax=Raoultibacter phocaeensis TaxID=2479841 RepID=UPI00111B6758|nr:leucine-rich repeat protein [Raoultibacter phocaeensis]
MLFDRGLAELLFVPAAKKGVAYLPDETTSADASVFSGTAELAAVSVGEGNQALAARDGMLYTRDLAELLYAPAAGRESAVITPETTMIAEAAFADATSLSTIVAPGHVDSIDSAAFADETKAEATVVLPGEEARAERKAVWEEAGFASFKEPAAPTPSPDGEGEPAAPPEPDEAGFAYTLLNDYTLSVFWQGEGEPESELAVPSTGTVDGVTYRVSEIAPRGFAGTGIASVAVPASVTAIGESAFAGCGNLAAASLEEGLRTVGASAFEGTALEDVVLPASVEAAGERAFADCASLARIVALSEVDAAPSAVEGCSGVSLYCPATEAEGYAWNPGVVASGNHVLPYGVALPAEPLTVEVGETADLFDGGTLEAPEGVEASFAYAAKPLSVDADGTVEGRKAGATEVAVSLELDGITLARASRTVEVVEASAEEPPAEGGEGTEGDKPADDGTEGDPEAPADDGTEGNEGDAPAEGEPGETPEGEEPAEGTEPEPGTEEPAEPVVPDYAILRSTAALSAEPLATAEVAPRATGDTFVSGNYTYTMLADGTVSIGQASASVPNSTSLVTFPSSVSYGGKSYTVSAVTARGFAGNTGLRRVKLPSTIKSMGAQAFKGCTVLERFDFSATSVPSIPDSCFRDTPKLSWTYFKMPTTLTSVGPSAFRNSTYMRAVTIPETVTSIGSYAFAGCTNLAKDVDDANTRFLRIPSVKRIEEGTFQGCTGMQWNRVKLATDLEYIGPRAFEGCSNMGSVKNLPDTLTYIGPYAFANCTKVSHVTLPYQIHRIEVGTFQGCTSLSWNGFTGNSGFTMEGSLQSIGNNAFKGCASLGGTLTISRANGKLSVADGLTIGDAAFERTAIKELNLPYGTASVGAWAFKDCASLTTANISSGVTELKDEVFYGCVKLKSVVGMDKISSIGNSAFYGCSALPSIDISDKVTILGNAAFSDCTSLATVNGAENVTTIGGSTFSNCTSLTAFEAPIKLTTIGSYAFNGCTNISKVILGPNVTKVEDNVFRGCTKLTDVLSLGSAAPSGGNSPFGGVLPTVYSPKSAVAGWATKVGTSKAKPITVSASVSELKLTYRVSSDPKDVTATTNFSTLGFGSVQASIPRTAPDGKVAKYVGPGIDDGSGVGSSKVYGYLPVNVGTTTVKFTLNCTYRGVTINNVAETSFTIKVEGYTYKIVYNANGGSGPSPYVQTVTYGQSVLVPNVSTCGFSRQGYTSTQWNTAENGSGTSYSSNQSLNLDPGPDATVPLYAQWSIVKYNIVYNGNGSDSGSGPASHTNINYDANVTLSSCAWGKFGYVFNGWNTQQNGSGTSYKAGQVVSKLSASDKATITLYAQWKGRTYTVGFSKYSITGPEGVSGDYPIADSPTCYYGGKVTVPQNRFTKTGYKFVGWNTRYDGKGTTYSVGASANVISVLAENNEGETTGKVSFYPVWEPITYYVYYDENYGAGSRPAQQTVKYDQDLTFSDKGSLNLPGKTFTGWGTERNGGTIYQPGAKKRNLTATDGARVTLYAQWRLNNYRISFGANGGSGNAPSSISTTTSVNVTMPGVGNLAREGYTFGGWNTQADGKGATYEAGKAYANLTLQDNVTVSLYAKWVPKQYKVRFNRNGTDATTGTDPQELTVTYDGTITMPNNPYFRTGYWFSGWNTRPNCQGTTTAASASMKVVDVLAEQPEADTRGGIIYLYVHWQHNKYTITMDGNYPTSAAWRDTMEAEYDRDVTIPQFPPTTECWKTGYTATGWTCNHADGSTSVHQPGEVVKKANFGTGNPGEPKDAVWLLIRWTANPYKLHFDANKPEGSTLSGSMADVDMVYDTAKNLPKNAFVCTADGRRFAFTGWNTKADGSGDAFADQAEANNVTSEKNKTVTLYAQWQELLVIDVTAPIKPCIGIEAYTGEVSAAKGAFSSRSSGDVRVAAAACTAAADAEKVFPQGSADVELTMSDGKGNDLALKLGGEASLAAGAAPDFVLAKGTQTNPSTLDVEFGLTIPEGVEWKPQDGPQNFAGIVFTIEGAGAWQGK